MDGRASGGAYVTTIATIVFLLSYFVTKGPIATEENLINLTYLEVAVLLLMFLVQRLAKLDGEGFAVMLWALPVYGLLVVHVLILTEGAEAQYLVKLTRLYLYLLTVYVFARCFFSWDVFCKWLLIFSVLSVLMGIVCVLYFPQYFTDWGYGFPRPRALLSEPSAYGPIIPLLLFISLHRKSWLGIAVATLGMYLAASGTVYFVTVFVAVIYFMRMAARSRWMVIYLAVAVAVGLLAGLLHGQIHDVMTGTFNYDRAIAQIASIQERGGSTRLASLFHFYEVLQRDGDLLWGKGMNSTMIFFREVDVNEQYLTSEFSLLHAALFSFGLAGVAGVLVLLIYAFASLWRKGNTEMLIVFSAFMGASLLNSSGGHVLYKFCYVFVILSLLSFRDIGVDRSRRSVMRPHVA